MSDESLDDLENLLAHRQVPLDPALKSRVMSEVRRELDMCATGGLSTSASARHIFKQEHNTALEEHLTQEILSCNRTGGQATSGTQNQADFSKSTSDSKRFQQESFWKFAWSAAAVALVMLNVTLFAANHTTWNFTPASAQQDTEKLAKSIREVLPELSEDEARYHARMLQGTVRPKVALNTPSSFAFPNTTQLLKEFKENE